MTQTSLSDNWHVAHASAERAFDFLFHAFPAFGEMGKSKPQKKIDGVKWVNKWLRDAGRYRRVAVVLPLKVLKCID